MQAKGNCCVRQPVCILTTAA